MSVPKSFQLINRRWKVKVVDTTYLLNWRLSKGEKEEDIEAVKGLCHHASATIFINKDEHTEPDDVQHTFWHEFAHALLYAQGCYSHDETVVDLQGALLAQYFQTVRGEQDC